MKTSELIGPALDWAVAKCERMPLYTELFLDTINPVFAYSSNWSQGGPIIEREKIAIIGWASSWQANTVEETEYDYYLQDSLYNQEIGTTPLIAAMRCYVASKLGEEIDIPEELL